MNNTLFVPSMNLRIPQWKTKWKISHNSIHYHKLQGCSSNDKDQHTSIKCSLETLNLLMELFRKIHWSMFFMLFHGHVLLRTFWMKLQSPCLRRWRKCASLHKIIKKDIAVDSHASRSLHVLLCCISLLKKFMQYSGNWTSSFRRKLQNISQIRTIREVIILDWFFFRVQTSKEIDHIDFSEL